MKENRRKWIVNIDWHRLTIGRGDVRNTRNNCHKSCALDRFRKRNNRIDVEPWSNGGNLQNRRCFCRMWSIHNGGGKRNVIWDKRMNWYLPGRRNMSPKFLPKYIAKGSLVLTRTRAESIHCILAVPLLPVNWMTYQWHRQLLRYSRRSVEIGLSSGT